MGITFSNTFNDITVSRDVLQEVVARELPQENDVSVFSMDARKNLYSINESYKLHIMVYATPSRTEGMQTIESIQLGEEIVELGRKVSRTPVIARSISGIVNVKDSNDTQIAHYDERQNILYIPINVFDKDLSHDLAEQLFAMVLRAFQQQIVSVRHLRYSWLHSPDKAQLTSSFEERMRRQIERQVNDDRRRLSNSEEQIQELIRRLRLEHDSAIRYRNAIEIGTKNADTATAKLLSDLDLIVKHLKFEDVRIKDGKITLITKDIYAYTKQDKRYHMGKYEIDVKMEDTNVIFRSNNRRRSYWSRNDHHPHINERGVACLGNVGGSIAELCAQSELYALALVLVDYLENVNIDDVAGRFVLNWDEVDEKGVVIKKGTPNGGGNMNAGEDDDRENTFVCERCDDIADMDDSRTVYTTYEGNGDIGTEVHWCEDCAGNHAEWNDHVEEYVTEDVSEDLENYHND